MLLYTVSVLLLVFLTADAVKLLIKMFSYRHNDHTLYKEI